MSQKIRKSREERALVREEINKVKMQKCKSEEKNER
jgi:hypothetical protein